MAWTVKVTKRALKQLDRLPVKVREALTDLIRDIEVIYAGTHEKATY